MPAMSPAERLRRARRAVLRRVHPHREPLVVYLGGDLGPETVKDTHRALQDALRTAPQALEVDLSRVTHLSAEGALPFFLAAHEARGLGIRFSVTHAAPHAKALMRRLGLERYLSAGTSGG